MKPPRPLYLRRARARYQAQRGVTLIVGMIMLVLVTLLVVNASTLSSSNLKAVGNMQVRQEVISAANEALELMVGSPFTNDPEAAAESLTVDMNNDGVTDYTVVMAEPVCVRALKVNGSTEGSGTETYTNNQALTAPGWNTEWDLRADVTDTATGASVTIRQGVRVRLTEAQKADVCP